MDSSNCVTNLIGEYPDWEGARVLQLLIQHPYTDIYASVVELCLANTIPPPEAENLRYHLAPIKMTDEATLKAVKKRLNQLIAVASENYGISVESLQQASVESLQPSPESNISTGFKAVRTTHGSTRNACSPHRHADIDSFKESKGDIDSRLRDNQQLPFVVHSTAKQETNSKQESLPSSPCNNSLLTKHNGKDSCKPEAESYATAEIRALTQYIKETTLPTGTIKCFNDDDTKAYRRQSAAIRRLLNQAIKDGHHEAVAIVKANLKKGKIMRWETL